MRNALIVLAVASLILGTDHSTPRGRASAADTGPGSAAAVKEADDWRPPMTADGWLDMKALLVPSDGSRLPGGQRRNDTRDRGSKLVFFDPGKGDNVTGEIYWWDGKRIVDSSGNAANAAGELMATIRSCPMKRRSRPSGIPPATRGWSTGSTPPHAARLVG